MFITILLLILKIIGIILLSIIGLILLIILLILFVPVRYQVKVSKYEVLNGRGRISYLLHILHINIDYKEGNPEYCIRLFGIPVKHSTSDKNNESNKANQDISNTVVHSTSPDTISETSKPTENNTSISNSEEKSFWEALDQLEEDGDIEDTILIEDICKLDSELEKPDIDNFKVLNFLIKIYHKLKEILKSLSVKLDKLSQKKHKIEDLLNFISTYKFQSALRKAWRTVIKLLTRLMPRRMKLDVRFGLEDPANTGYLMAVLSILSDKIKGSYNLKPDFHNEIFEGSIELKGRIIVIELLIPALKLLLDKNFRTVYKQYKSTTGNNKGGK